jgi:hypothetical protein
LAIQVEQNLPRGHVGAHPDHAALEPCPTLLPFTHLPSPFICPVAFTVTFHTAILHPNQHLKLAIRAVTGSWPFRPVSVPPAVPLWWDPPFLGLLLRFPSRGLQNGAQTAFSLAGRQTFFPPPILSTCGRGCYRLSRTAALFWDSAISTPAHIVRAPIANPK